MAKPPGSWDAPKVQPSPSTKLHAIRIASSGGQPTDERMMACVDGQGAAPDASGLNRKTPWFACKVLVQHDCTHSKRKPCILAVPEGRWWALECYAPRADTQQSTRRRAERLEPLAPRVLC
jgi:hypothetical protein